MNIDSIRQLVPAILCAIFLSACSTPKVKYIDPPLSRNRAQEPVFLVPPLNPDPGMKDICSELGRYYLNAFSANLPGQVTYAGNIESLTRAMLWDNIVNNGQVNTKEVSTIARTLGCNSAFTVRVMLYKQYPPFRMVVEMLWIDCLSGNVIAKLYDDVDMTNSDVAYRFENYVGDGPTRTVYETFTVAPYKGLAKTAELKPSTFLNFVADYSTNIMVSEATDKWYAWWLWRIF